MSDDLTKAELEAAQWQLIGDIHPADFGLWIGIWCAVASVLAFVMILGQAHVYKERPPWGKAAPFLLVGITAWLWVPWVAVGIHWVSTSNVNAAKYEEMAPEVIPAERDIIDLRDKSGSGNK